MPKPPELTDQTNILPKRQLIPVFLAMSMALFIAMVDQNSISVGLATIGRELDAMDTISWAGTSALISNTVFQVLYGRLSDIFGRKGVFIAAMFLLGVTDLGCGFAKTSTQLYVLRGLAGIANGGITALTMMIVSDVVTLEQRGKYQGILGAMFGLGNTVGPFLSAAFVTHVTWRALFWLVSPLTIISAAVTYWILPPTQKSPNEKSFMEKVRIIDFWGVATSAAAIITILIPVSGGGDYFPWSSPMVIAMLSVGGFLAVCFVLVEVYVAKLPMMPMRLFRNPPVCAILTQNMLFGVVYYSNIYYLPMYYQLVRGWNITISAALLVPFLLGQSLFSITSGQYIARTGRYGEIIWTGYFLWTLSAGLKCIFNRETHPAAIAIILALEGFGAGFVFQPTLVAAQAHSAKEDRAVVISVRNFLRCLGGAVGLAISSAILSNVLNSNLPTGTSGVEFSTYGLPDMSGFTKEQREDVLDAYMAASRAVFIMCVPFMACCLIINWWVKDRGLQRKEEKDEEIAEKSGSRSELSVKSGADLAGDAEGRSEPEKADVR